MTQLEETIGYSFKDSSLLQHALTHSSYANEHHDEFLSNERLEFLGDSVLGIVTGEYLYTTFPKMPEGELSKLRASLVCEQSLFDFATQISLGDHLVLGRGEMHSGGNTRPSILADAFEAVIAAIYLDGGMEPAKRHILGFITKAIRQHKTSFHDYKTALQEIVQKNKEEQVVYMLAGETGPDHDKRFEVEVRLNSNVIGAGVGRSKKQAEQEAAKEALKLMGVCPQE